jgi:hypothetical protein
VKSPPKPAAVKSPPKEKAQGGGGCSIM